MQYLKLALRLLMALLLMYAGVGHLSFAREKFELVVPYYLRFSNGFVDFLVLGSGLVEIAFALGLCFSPRKYLPYIGLALAVFYVLVFPGNVHQYMHSIDIPPLLASEQARFIRLFLQPVLIVWAIYACDTWGLIRPGKK